MIEHACHFKTIEKVFPHLADKIKTFWGYPEFVVLMCVVRHNASREMRDVYPTEVHHALSELEAEHNQLFPHLSNPNKTPWIRIFFGMISSKLRDSFKAR